MTEAPVSESPSPVEPDRLAGIRRRPSGELPPLPRHFSRTTLRLLAISGVVTIVWFLIGFDPVTSSWISLHEGLFMVKVAAHRTEALSSFFTSLYGILFVWTVPVVGWATIVVLVIYQRWRHLLVFFASLLVNVVVVGLLQEAIERPRPYGISILGRWDGWATPSHPVASATAVLTGAALALIPPGRGRRIAPYAVVVAMLVYAVLETYLGVSHPTDQLLAVLVGGTIPLLMFRLFAPEEVFPISYGKRGNTAHLDITGARGDAIRLAIRYQLGLTVLDVKPVGLEGSAGSTPLRLTVEDAVTGEPRDALFAKLLARSHLRSDRFYKLFRTLRYGRLEDENKFLTVRRLVSQEDYLALRMEAAGIKVPRSLGVIEITPEREYMVVTEFLEGFVEIGDVEHIGQAMIDNALAVVRRMWDAGLAHRDVKPSNVMVRGDEVALIDVAFGQVRPSPWRQAIDLANMMLVLALRSDPELVYQRACLQFSRDDIAEAFAASRGITLPSQVRQQMKRDGRDLLVVFRGLGPSRPPIKIQRWSWRRVGLTVWVAVVVVLILVFGLSFLERGGVVSVKRFVTVIGIVIAVLAVGVVVGLHRSEAEPSVTLDATRCVRNQRTILTAQTVPGATLVPCLTDDAAGWTVTAQSYTNDGTTLSYRNDTVVDATWDMEFTATCAPQDGTTAKDGQVDGVPTTGYAVEPGTHADDESEVAEVAWTRFPGGCVKTTVTVPDTVDRRLILAESDGLVVLIPRRLLDDDVVGSNDGRIPL